MKAVASLSCCLVVLMNSPLVAQEATGTQGLAGQVAQLTEEVAALKAQLAQTSENVTEALTLTQQNKSNIEANAELINAQLEEQRQILEAISHKDSTGQAIPRIAAIMDNSADFRQEMKQAVNQSIERTGRFVVNNKMQTTQSITVNGTGYSLMPGQQMLLTVPVGTVTTQFPGGQLQTWTLAAPSYQQSLDIVPDPSSVAVTAYYVDPWDWYYVGF